MYVQKTDYLLRKRGGVNCTRRSFPVKRWMNKYMRLIIQVEKKNTYVFVMNGHMRVCLTGKIGGIFCISLLCQREKELSAVRNGVSS